jgi:hypothetical protein
MTMQIAIMIEPAVRRNATATWKRRSTLTTKLRPGPAKNVSFAPPVSTCEK